jgi:hypothetical protein
MVDFNLKRNDHNLIMSHTGTSAEFVGQNVKDQTSASALEQSGARPFCPLRLVIDLADVKADAEATEQKGLLEPVMF